MKKGLLVCAICLVAGVVFWGQGRRADAVSSEIAALTSQIEQVTQEMEQLRAILEKGTAEAADREQQRTLLEQELARARFRQVIWPTPEEEAKGLWRVKYQVSAFPEEAAALRKKFADSVSDLLKGEKARLFLDSMGRWADMPFSAFGQKEMTILFEWTRAADDQWALHITETGINNSGPVKCGRTTTRQLQQTNIPPYWRHLIRS